ncbi:MAG TPA: hypothetical protein VLT32_18150 [Candidatus Sulfomarinibacteraceae bacterium]|nr:hypothetical protein [Candidatus Sulfomarinibacteraceae bacterium]
MDDVRLTEEDAALAWALAYNTHDPSVLAPILADDVRVMSRWVIRDLVGREPYLDYLARKFTTFERAGSLVRVELAVTPGPGGRPCALLEQDGVLLATVLFDVIGGRLSMVSLSAEPAPASCRRSGHCPGFQDGAVGPVN